MITISGAVYKDVSHQDFTHYFGGTAMAYKLSETKRRLYLVSTVANGHVTGQYLTREKEFKSKDVPWKGWWDHLEPIISGLLMFNVSDGGCVWYHRTPKNMKKSFVWNTSFLSFFGQPPNHAKTMQNIGYEAFYNLYGAPKSYPSLYETLLSGKSAVTKERFVVDNHTKRLFFCTAKVGTIQDDKILLSKDKEFFKDFLLRKGLSTEQIIVTNEPPATTINVSIIPQHLNTQWHTGFSKGNPNFQPGYCVYTTQLGSVDVRTYAGVFPGSHNLMPGWTLHCKWNEHGVEI